MLPVLEKEGAAQRAAMVTEEPSVLCQTGRAQAETSGTHQTLHGHSAELQGFHSIWEPSGGLLVVSSALEVDSPRVSANLPF